MRIDLPAADHRPLSDPPLRLVACELHFGGATHPEDGALARRWYEDLGGREGFFPKLGAVRETRFEVRTDEEDPRIHSEDQHGWRFQSDEEETQLTLMPGVMALATTKFTKWADFAPHMSKAVSLLARDLEPTVEVRVGLRFVNEFPGAELHNVLSPSAQGLFAHEVLGTGISSSEMKWKVLLTDGFESSVRVARPGNQDGAALVLDIDTYREASAPFDEPAIQDAIGTLNGRGVSIFQQVISSDYLSALHSDSGES